MEEVCTPSLHLDPLPLGGSTRSISEVLVEAQRLAGVTRCLVPEPILTRQR